MKISFCCIVLFFLRAELLLAINPDFTVENLKCEQMINPLAVESQHPVLSWQMLSGSRAKNQQAYRILVSSSISLLSQNKGDYWDSGRVPSARSILVAYQGKKLMSREQVYWKVMIWDEDNRPSAWSPAASWSMGLLEAGDWKANWIGFSENPDPDAPLTYPAPFFRKTFRPGKKINRATVYICGLGFYELYLNGKKIGDQVLAPAVTNYDRRPLHHLLYPYDDQSAQRVLYNTFDVTGNLLQDDNAIGVLLGNGWYNQRDRRVEGDMWYDDPKLIFQLEIMYADGTRDIVGSDNSWKTSRGPLLKDGIFSGEQYDARLELGEWDRSGYDDRQWRSAITVRPPSGSLISQLAPFDKVIRAVKPEFKGKISDSVYVYHLAETLAGWASIQVKGKAGNRIKLRYISEEGDDYGQFDQYILKGGHTERWAPRFTWHAFRSIEVTSPDVALDQESLLVEVVHTDVAPNGDFNCSNAFLNQINSAYLKTQQANFHGSLSSDCPHRERLGYTGDGQVVMESALFSFDLFRFYQKWFNDMDDSRNKKTGFVTHTAPFAGGGGGPAWGSAYVIMPWLYYRYYGDSVLLSHHYNGMKQWLEYLTTRTDQRGLVTREEPKGWCLGDWCTPDGVQIPEPLVNTAYYYHVADLMQKVAVVLNKKEDATRFVHLAQEIKDNFNRAYFNEARKTYWEGRQGADVFALAFGLVPDGEYEAVFQSLLIHLESTNYHFDTGILGTPLLLKVLSRNDRDDLAYKIMNQRDFPSFGYLNDSKNSTLWESWNGEGSKCHPMFGSVVAWFYEGLSGIKPDPASPGMKHFIIEPKPVADLRHCKSSYESLFGKIRSEWSLNEAGNLEVLIEVPANSSATFVLPGQKKKIREPSGKTAPAQKWKDKFGLEFQSGIYRFEVL